MAFLGNGFTPHKSNKSKSAEREYQYALNAARQQHGKPNPHVSGVQYPEEAPSNYSQQDDQGSIFNTVMRDPMNQTGSLDLRTSSTEVPSISAEQNAREQMGQQRLDQRMAMGVMPNLNNHSQVYGGRSRG